MYSDETLDLFKQIKHMGVLEGDDVLIGEVGNKYCGDIMRLFLRVHDGVIKEAKFKTYGCVAAILSMDVACEMLVGMNSDEALKITNEDVLARMGDKIPAQKVHCSLMAQDCIRLAILK